MNNIKKHFGYINMTREFEETIQNNKKQMEELYEKIEELKKIIEYKNIEINLLNEKNNIYLNIIQKNNIKISENTKKEMQPKELFEKEELKINGNDVIENKNNNFESIKSDFKFTFDYSNKSNINNKEHNTDTPIPTPTISSDSDNTIHDRIRIIKNKIIKVLIISYFKNKYSKIKVHNEKQMPSDKTYGVSEEDMNSKNGNKIKKIRPERNKELPILDRFKVKFFTNEDLKDSEVLQFVGSEDCFLIEYQYKISDKINKKIDDITIDDVINFKIKYEGLRNTYTRRTEFKRLITRCRYLYEKHNKKLSMFKISLSHLKIMSEDDWDEWIIEFDKLVEDVSNKEKICHHKYKNGNICNKLNCKIKHKEYI